MDFVIILFDLLPLNNLMHFFQSDRPSISNHRPQWNVTFWETVVDSNCIVLKCKVPDVSLLTMSFAVSIVVRITLS